jgi:hypothetical protein
MTNRQPDYKHDKKGGELVLSPEARHALERAVRRFCKTNPCPHGYSPDEWRAECHGEAWAIVPDVLRTYNAAKGCLETYLYEAVQKHLTSVYARECRWQQRHLLLLDAPLLAGGEEEGEPWEVMDEASVGLAEQLCWRLAVEEALSYLSAIDRLLVEWVWMEGCSQKEVVQRLREQGIEMTQPAISKRLKRVRAFLRDYWGGE